MDEWIDAVRQELGLDSAVDVDVILDVARVAAHNVARPAAPVTTFLLGVAAAGGADVADAARRIEALAVRVAAGPSDVRAAGSQRTMSPADAWPPRHHREAVGRREPAEHPRADVVDGHALAVDESARHQPHPVTSGRHVPRQPAGAEHLERPAHERVDDRTAQRHEGHDRRLGVAGQPDQHAGVGPAAQDHRRAGADVHPLDEQVAPRARQPGRARSRPARRRFPRT